MLFRFGRLSLYDNSLKCFVTGLLELYYLGTALLKQRFHTCCISFSNCNNIVRIFFLTQVLRRVAIMSLLFRKELQKFAENLNTYIQMCYFNCSNVERLHQKPIKYTYWDNILISEYDNMCILTSVKFSLCSFQKKEFVAFLLIFGVRKMIHIFACNYST